ncbi:hypothetical protein GCM10009119_22560 [Algoriphagus jejuensis]|uniref:NAD(P)-binding protein n=1 Tax=Algoriphagus jejuensis TaxID=419934 RepID=A0ABP3YE26_9BACT
MPSPITLIGAGIGGLTAALTLKQLGDSVDVYESEAEIRPVWTGIVLANNGESFHNLVPAWKRVLKAA